MWSDIRIDLSKYKGFLKTITKGREEGIYPDGYRLDINAYNNDGVKFGLGFMFSQDRYSCH